MKITFLLGSGISIPANLPGVEKLTNAVLAGEDLIVEKNGKLDRISSHARSLDDEQEGREKLRRILIFLDWLKAQAACRYVENRERSVTYEDLAYLAGQIHDDLADEYENPALQPFVRNVVIDLGGLFGDTAPSAARNELRELACSTVGYIRSAVGLLLKTPHADSSYLQIFADACRDESVTEKNLFTLNHDILLEEFLKESGLRFVDGLREACNGDGSRRWDPSVFDDVDSQQSVKVFKLHGSVDWFRWELKTGGSQTKILVDNADRNGRFIGTYNKTGTELYERILQNEGPQLLVGTFNKILGYNSEMFLELHYRFHRALQDCKTLVICGYGFGDKGVNTRIAEWRHHSSEHKLLIIDPSEPSKIVQKARGAIRREIAAIDAKSAIDIPPGPVEHWPNGLAECLESTGDRVVTWERLRATLRCNCDPSR